jgi:DNA polymerase III subunit epsilon
LIILALDMAWWKDLLGSREQAAFVRAYEDSFSQRIPNARTVGQLSFVILDTETTGLNVKSDYILSFGAIKLKKYCLRVDSCIEVYLKAPSIPGNSYQVHELLTPTQVTDLRQFAEQLLAYIGTDILVGHHLSFDLSMLQKALKPFGFRKFMNPTLDTIQLAMRLEQGIHYDSSFGKPEEYALDTLCKRYAVPLDDRHTAAGDALLTAQLLMKLLKKAENMGIKDFGTLFR